MSDDLPRVRRLYPVQMERSILGAIYEDDPNDHFSGGKYRSEIRAREQGLAGQAHSMIGHRRVRTMCEDVIQSGIRGEFIETGVWRGEACMMMRAVLAAYGDRSRQVFV